MIGKQVRHTFQRLEILALLGLLACNAAAAETDDGYRGIWYYNQPTKDEYRYKYSGGMATYPQWHLPIAIHCAAAKKTFFVYGGTTARKADDKQELLHMVSYFDHETGTVPRPVILLNKKTDDAHDNPVLSVDGAGYLWVFSPSHGTGRPSYIHRSAKPHAIDAFERIAVTNFSYPQPWALPDGGFLFLHTRYGPGSVHGLFTQRSADGATWEAPRPFATIEQGDYQVSWRSGKRVATAFDFHPKKGGLNARANVYYLETADGGSTWRTAAGEVVALPLTNAANPALIHDSRAEKELVYLKDINFDGEGHPVILFLTSKGFEPGPANGPRTWQTMRWTGKDWERRPVTTSLNNYDHGSLYIEPTAASEVWRIIGPTEPGPQPGNPGGEIALWTSEDRGATWTKVKQLTSGSVRNHTYVRRPFDAHPDFYALWADGHGREPSTSRIHFTDRDGTRVWRLPGRMDGDRAKPEVVK